MGTGKINIYAEFHGQLDWGNELKLRVHQGNISLDSTAPVLDPDDLDTIKDGMATQYDFDMAVAEVGGLFETWYDSFSSTIQGIIFTVLKREIG